MEIKRFKINKLHGTLDFDLKFNDNTLILLGENGSCKTTIIKMLYYTLSLQYGKLNMYDYESIEIFIDDDNYKLEKKVFNVFAELLFNQLPPQIVRSFNNRIESESDGHIILLEVEEFCKQNNTIIEKIIERYYQSMSGEAQIKVLIDTMLNLHQKVKNVQIIYLPTYRRIEEELTVILNRKIDEDDTKYRYTDSPNYMELIEFGMHDVEMAINKTLSDIKDLSRLGLYNLTLSYLGDIVDGKYEMSDTKEISNIDDMTINQILSRVDESILSKKQKNKLLKILQDNKNKNLDENEHDRVLIHYFLKLYDLHKRMSEKETSFRNFVDVCNRYSQNKTVNYDNSNFSFSITSKYDEHNIELYQLSSGEKQIVSLFSHLYLSNKNNYLVLIDEPELSLSVKWQKTFLEDVRKVAFCNGLVAVTHSPFIFDNSLDEYAHGIEEFRK